jgi:hypothetical protein
MRTSQVTYRARYSLAAVAEKVRRTVVGMRYLAPEIVDSRVSSIELTSLLRLSR